MLAPDTILQGRYRIIRQLGKGGMGAVYEAIDQRLDTTVALKETLFSDERLRKQFEREARLLARLHHPALPRVSDHFSEGDGQFLVMQYIPGEDLSVMIGQKQGPFPTHQVLTWADQLLDALDYLHTQDPQIIHRDIKPQNLKLTARGQIILLDFGLAKGQAGDISRITTGASIFGYTPNYAPLEQIQGLGTDSRSDIYSLGATLYHLLTGVKPPDALTRAAALVNAQEDPLQPASELNKTIAPELSAILQKSMAQNREQRYSTAAEMRKSLHGTEQASTISNRGEADTVLFPNAAATRAAATNLISRQQPTIAGSETTVVRQPTQKRTSFTWVASAAVLAVIAVGVCALYFLQKRSDIGVQVLSTKPTPAPSVAASSSTTPVTPAPEVENKALVEKPKVESTAKKVESRPARTEEKKPAQPRGFIPPSPPDVEVGHSGSGSNEEPDNAPGNRPRGARTITRVTAGGVIIRNFPDGSQMITTPDGSRVYVGPDGKKQILQPGQKANRRRVPPPAPTP